MNVVDSSAWLEYIADGPNAGFFSAPIARVDALIVPSIVVYEVYKRLRGQLGDKSAGAAIAVMLDGLQVEFDFSLALRAARLSADLKLPMADSIILATAQVYDAVLWTQDADFQGLDKVRYRAAASS